MTQRCALVDLDGTLSDPTHRQHFLDKTPRDWDGFFKTCGDDPCHEHVRFLVTLIRTVMPICIVSGRRNDMMAETVNWMAFHQVPFDYMFMRPVGDFRDDTILKKEILTHIRGLGLNPAFAIDDRPSVIAMWKTEGIPVFAVNGESWSEQADVVRRKIIAEIADKLEGGMTLSDDRAAAFVRTLK